jgi:hypothetical protein
MQPKIFPIPVNPDGFRTLNSHDSRRGVKAIERNEMDLMTNNTGKDDE